MRKKSCRLVEKKLLLFMFFMEQTHDDFISAALQSVTDRREHLFKESELPEAETSTNTAPASKHHCIKAFL